MNRLSVWGQLVRRPARLLGWTIIDQALFAMSNFVITLAVARGGGTHALGSFSVAFASYLIVLGCSRSLFSEPLLATAHRQGDESGEKETLTLTILFAAAAALLVSLAALLVGRVELLVAAAALPITLIQDVLRYHAFRRGKPAVAALLDGGWLMGSVAVWPVVTNSSSPSVAILCWAGAAAIGIGAGYCALLPKFSKVSSATRWWRCEARGLATPLLLDSVIVAVSSQAVIFVVASAAGDDALGTLRAGQIYFGPVMVAFGGLGILVVPRLAQRPHLNTRRFAIWLPTVLAVAATLISVIIIAAEPIIHVVLFTGAIEVPHALLIPLACQVILAFASGGFVIVSKARQRGGDIVRSRLTSTLIGLSLLIAATAIYGIQGAVWALVVQTLLYTVELGVRVMKADSSTSASRSIITVDIHA